MQKIQNNIDRKRKSRPALNPATTTILASSPFAPDFTLHHLAAITFAVKRVAKTKAVPSFPDRSLRILAPLCGYSLCHSENFTKKRPVWLNLVKFLSFRISERRAAASAKTELKKIHFPVHFSSL